MAKGTGLLPASGCRAIHFLKPLSYVSSPSKSRNLTAGMNSIAVLLI